MSIAVLKEKSGHGIGTRLISAFLMEMRRQDISSVSLTTDRDDNEYANRFYQKLGFHVARTYQTPEGRWMNEYVIDLINDASEIS